ncbi:MAG TPA: MotA/TolQ/ExbB proton channel family protein [Polyangia bacterium]
MSHALTDALVKGTLVSLIVFSVATWAVVLLKLVQYVRVWAGTRRFHRAFGQLNTLPNGAEIAQHRGPAARVIRAGLSAVKEADSGDGPRGEDRLPYIENRLRQQIQEERRSLEGGLAILASIGTTAPFVGLFGTVFGIIDALKRIGSAGSASIDVVAGPIGEALIATGLGIAVAVPAVLAYNFFVRRGKGQFGHWEHIAASFINLALKRGGQRLERVAPARELAFPREASV